MTSVYDVDIGDWVQTIDKQWHEIIGIKFHTRKIKQHTPCIGKHKKPQGLIRNWTITTKDNLVLDMMRINGYKLRKRRKDKAEKNKELTIQPKIFWKEIIP